MALKKQKKGSESSPAKLSGDLYYFEFDEDISSFKPFGKPSGFPVAVWAANLNQRAGTSYVNREKGRDDKIEYLVHFPTLLQLARKVGLEMVDISNFLNFYEDYKKTYEPQLVEIMGWGKTERKMIDNQLELIGTLFFFQGHLNS